MKANEALEKLYISNYSSGFTYNWHLERLAEKDIEYTRTDAFIEKAWEWVENNILSSSQQDKSLLYYKQFINCMEGK